MKISKIITAEPFNKLFPCKDSVLSNLTSNMRSTGFDPCHPVILWKGQNILIDGHTRVEAARLAGLQEIDVVERDFTDDDDALSYAIRCQRDRRNLTDAEIMSCVDALDELRQRGGDHCSEKAKASLEATAPAGKSAEATAKLIGTSRVKVEKIRAVKANATLEVKKAVEDGKLTINRAYNTLKKSTPKAAPAEAPKPKSPKPATLRSLWISATKDERARFLAWVDQERAKDLPKAEESDVYAVVRKLKRILKQRPQSLQYAVGEIKSLEARR